MIFYIVISNTVAGRPFTVQYYKDAVFAIRRAIATTVNTNQCYDNYFVSAWAAWMGLDLGYIGCGYRGNTWNVVPQLDERAYSTPPPLEGWLSQTWEVSPDLKVTSDLTRPRTSSGRRATSRKTKSHRLSEHRQPQHVESPWCARRGRQSI